MNKIRQIVPYIIVALITYIFYTFAYGFTLRYGEQFQLFQTTYNYFAQLASRPGGLTMYVGRYLTQFFIFPPLGALFITLFTLLTMFSVRRILKTSEFGLPVAIAIALLNASQMLDNKYELNCMIAVSLTSFAIFLWNLIKNKYRRFGVLFLLTFVLYWIIGGFAILSIYIFAILDMLVRRTTSCKRWFCILFIGITIIAIPIIARQFFDVQYNMYRTFIGVDYIRYSVTIPTITIVIFTLLAIIPIFNKILKLQTRLNRHKKHKDCNEIVRTRIAVWAEVTIIITLVIFCRINLAFNRLCAYDFYGRTQNWDKIIELADEKSPQNKLSVMYLNLALGKKGQLCNKMFNYYQKNAEGLIPLFTIDINIPMMTSEVLYHLGFINSAERFAFEASKALPDYQESARTVKRLAEANIIKENYALANKYLTMLENTSTYAKWARICKKHIEDGTTNNVQEWATLRSYINKKDYLYSDSEIDKMLGQLFLANEDNIMAYEYLMAYCLLNKDLVHFSEYLSFSQNIYRGPLPQHFREAILYQLSITNTEKLKEMSQEDLPLVQQMNRFAQIYNQNKQDKRLKEEFGGTYWYYLLCE